MHWKDTFAPHTHVTVGDEEPSYNRIWYQVGSDGYAHSSDIQPVRTILNEPDSNIPDGGALAEITVPVY